jgi:L-alanine-DL-glutamate epimerase-like enolase superfamily enzyme
MEIHIEKKLLHFKKPSGTSRGILYDKPSWVLSIQLLNGHTALGECSVIPGLSPDFIDEHLYEKKLIELKKEVESNWSVEEFQLVGVFTSVKWMAFIQKWSLHPSILFGMETLAHDIFNGGIGLIFESGFTRKERSIPINGLIWMGDESFMLEQMEEKLADGFSTIKMKIGAIEWKKEYALLEQLRSRFSSRELTLRVDANGAFTPKSVLPILNQLRELEVHSIEQPIQAGQLSAMSELCKYSPIGIALDEEMIGIHKHEKKEALLKMIAPQFIVLKPSLHGGFQGCSEWIRLAEENQIAWWMTSALESSIGLNAIAQFTATFEDLLPQGLGTGGLYTNNFVSSLVVEKGQLRMK